MPGAAISPWLPDGRLRRRAEREVAPFVYAGAAILSPALFAGAPAGRVLADAAVRPRRRDAAACSACGSKAVWMHVGTPEAVAAAEAALARQHWRSTLRCRAHACTIRAMPIANAPRVFTIPASAPFLPTLIEALRGGKLCRLCRRRAIRSRLPRATLYLPTRRACRLARDAFLDVLDGDAAILPRIVALGDIDEDEIAFAEAATGGIAADALALPPALGGLERRLLLDAARSLHMGELAGAARAEAARRWSPTRRPRRCALADDLARLIDDMTTRERAVGAARRSRAGRVRRILAAHAAFLQIARELWPDMLDERGAIEPAERRDALIKAEAARLARKTDGPVIAAGSTGSIPATAELIATIAHLPHGAVVLPGLDTDLDEASWRLIAGDESKRIAPAPGHPQFAMQALLARIGIARDAVDARWHTARGRERLRLGSAAPGRRDRSLAAARSPTWRSPRMPTPRFERSTVIEAANAEEEALAIAVALREAVQDGKTAALVTPDRALGRRVARRARRAGTSRRKIPAAMRSPKRRPGFLPGSPPKPRSAVLRR